MRLVDTINTGGRTSEWAVRRHGGAPRMGFAISWLAVNGKSPEAVTEELGLTPTGEFTDYAESVFTGRTLYSGWFILVIDAYDHDFAKPDSLAALSGNCEVVACSIEEHGNYCSCELWSNGTRSWRIEHNAEKGVEHISRSGTLPDGYSVIERKYSEEQKQAGGKNADTDYHFEIPLQVAKSIVGFKHDEPGPEDDTFQIYSKRTDSSPATPSSDLKRRPWWKLW